MTEKLKQKAEEYAEKMHFKRLYGCKPVVMNELLKTYIAGATEATKEQQEENKELNLKIDRLESYCDAYNYSQQTYQEEIKDLEAQVKYWKSEYDKLFNED